MVVEITHALGTQWRGHWSDVSGTSRRYPPAGQEDHEASGQHPQIVVAITHPLILGTQIRLMYMNGSCSYSPAEDERGEFVY